MLYSPRAAGRAPGRWYSSPPAERARSPTVRPGPARYRVVESVLAGGFRDDAAPAVEAHLADVLGAGVARGRASPCRRRRPAAPISPRKPRRLDAAVCDSGSGARGARSVSVSSIPIWFSFAFSRFGAGFGAVSAAGSLAPLDCEAPGRAPAELRGVDRPLIAIIKTVASAIREISRARSKLPHHREDLGGHRLDGPPGFQNSVPVMSSKLMVKARARPPSHRGPVIPRARPPRGKVSPADCAPSESAPPPRRRRPDPRRGAPAPPGMTKGSVKDHVPEKAEAGPKLLPSWRKFQEQQQRHRQHHLGHQESARLSSSRSCWRPAPGCSAPAPGSRARRAVGRAQKKINRAPGGEGGQAVERGAEGRAGWASFCRARRTTAATAPVHWEAAEFATRESFNEHDHRSRAGT